ncbi:hypothetical protein U1Q18_051885 [Sarracenia purpurea var. burkii]
MDEGHSNDVGGRQRQQRSSSNLVNSRCNRRLIDRHSCLCRRPLSPLPSCSPSPLSSTDAILHGRYPSPKSIRDYNAVGRIQY